MTLAARSLRLTLHGRTVLDGIDLTVSGGELHVLLGANGAGKSSLLRTLAGDLRPSSGEVQLHERPITEYAPAELAQLRAVLPQRSSLDFPFRVREVVALGRLPHGDEASAAGQAAIAEALQAAGVAAMAERAYTELSGGEQDRVQFARVLAQVWSKGSNRGSGDVPARFLLLDEPTAHLDLAHQQQCLAVTRVQVVRGLGVIAALHDPNLAMAYADRVSLLQHGRILASGHPLQVMTAAALSRLYGVAIRVQVQPDLVRPLVAVVDAPHL